MSLSWVENLLPEGYFKKKMFGGSAYYMDEKLVLLEFASEGNKEYRGVKYDFEIWNGCLFPVEKDRQPAVLKRFPFLLIHPVLPKWLYLPADTEDFESHVELLVREIRRRNPDFGTIPKAKKAKASSKKSMKDESEIIDTRRPKMFSEEPAENRLQKAREISDLKNLGEESERILHAAGIKTAPQLIKMGWQKAMVQLVKSDPMNNHSIFAYAVIGALQNKRWNLISEEDKAEARRFMKSLRDKNAEEKKPFRKKATAKRKAKKSL